MKQHRPVDHHECVIKGGGGLMKWNTPYIYIYIKDKNIWMMNTMFCTGMKMSMHYWLRYCSAFEWQQHIQVTPSIVFGHLLLLDQLQLNLIAQSICSRHTCGFWFRIRPWSASFSFSTHKSKEKKRNFVWSVYPVALQFWSGHRKKRLKARHETQALTRATSLRLVVIVPSI